MSGVVVIGYGHHDRGDDAVGLLVIDALKQDPPAEVDLCGISGDAIRLIECWEACEVAILVHATDTGRIPGMIQRFEGREGVAAAAGTLTTVQSLTVRESLQLGEILGRMPQRFIFYGIEAHQFEPGTSITPAVREAVEMTAERVRAECARLRPGPAGG